jgi:elongation factor 2
LHLEICLKDLSEDFMKGAEISISDPVVSFMEGIQKETGVDCIGKSPNKHNRIYLQAEPLSDELCSALESDDITMEMEAKTRVAMLVQQHDWSKDEAQKIWKFGCPPDAKMNILCDLTSGVQYVNEIKDSMNSAFQQGTYSGVLCDEHLRGVRFNLMDLTLHADAIHRGAGQIMPPMKRAMACCQLRSDPCIMEPMYLVDITVPDSAANGVYSTISTRRGEVVSQEQSEGNPILNIKAYLPVLESFGFTGVLRQNTSGQAFPQMIFSHWSVLAGNPLDETGLASKIMDQVREKKGMKEAKPTWSDYYDKV